MERKSLKNRIMRRWNKRRISSPSAKADTEMKFLEDFRLATFEEPLNPLLCASIFTSPLRLRRIEEYEFEIEKLKHVVKGFADSLLIIESQGIIGELIDKLDSPHLLKFVDSLLIHDPTAHLIAKRLLDYAGESLKADVIESIIQHWRQELLETQENLNCAHDYVSPGVQDSTVGVEEMTLVVMSVGVRQKFNEICEVARSCLDESYMSGMTNVLYDLQERNQQINPFVITIAPSGTGKTTLAYNLGMSEIPLLYFVYNCCGNFQSQDKYRPFQVMSEQLIKVINEDLRHLNVDVFHEPISPKKVDTYHVNMIESDHSYESEYRTVDFICSIFEAMFEIRARNEELTWLECQTFIRKVKIKKTSIADGLLRLDSLRHSEYRVPFVLFVDEAVLKSGDQVGTTRDDWKSSEIIFLRTISRLLNLIPFLAGTEATSSDFCGMGSHHSRVDGVSSIWCCCIRDLPSYSQMRFVSNFVAVKNKFGKDPAVESIISFIESCTLYENPYLIDLAFDFFLIELPRTHCHDLGQLLNELLLYVFRSFVRAKKSPELFTDSQVSYVFAYEWKDSRLIPKNFAETAVNRHLAQLAADSVSQGEPHTYLTLQKVDSLEKSRARDTSSTGNISCPKYLESRSIYTHPYKPNLKGKSKKDDIDVAFEPSSTFVAFKDAPLTGLVLFGLNTSLVDETGFYPPFISDSDLGGYCRRPSIDAVIRHTLMNPNADENYWLTGKFLECLYTTATVAASRSNGVEGCTLPVFLAHFIRELTPSRSNHRVFFKHLPCLKLPESTKISNDFKSRIIPLVSPMAVDVWPSKLVKLLKEVSNGKCRLGTFWFSVSNEAVDHMIIELDLNPSNDGQDLINEVSNVGKSNKHYTKDDPELDITFCKPGGKHYCNWGHVLQTKFDSIKAVSLIGECKLICRPLTLLDIINMIVLKKFDNKGIDGKSSCRSYIALVLKTSNLMKQPNAKNREVYFEKLHLVNEKGFHLWVIKRKSEDDITDSYLLEDIAGQRSRQSHSKDVFIVSLEDIVGKAFLKSLQPSKRK